MERLTHAECSSDLGEAIDGELGDVDVLRAAGMAAQQPSINIALALSRLLAGDKRALYTVVDGLQGHAAKLNIEHAEHAIVNVIEWLVAPKCEECFGRGKMLLYGTHNFLSDDDCTACAGTGDRDPKFTDKEKALRDWLYNLQGLATGAIRRKLRDEG